MSKAIAIALFHSACGTIGFWVGFNLHGWLQ
jgi:hypothetical protein